METGYHDASARGVASAGTGSASREELLQDNVNFIVCCLFPPSFVALCRRAFSHLCKNGETAANELLPCTTLANRSEDQTGQGMLDDLILLEKKVCSTSVHGKWELQGVQPKKNSQGISAAKWLLPSRASEKLESRLQSRAH